jgi:hypothetical protein
MHHLAPIARACHPPPGADHRAALALTEGCGSPAAWARVGAALTARSNNPNFEGENVLTCGGHYNSCPIGPTGLNLCFTFVGKSITSIALELASHLATALALQQPSQIGEVVDVRLLHELREVP